MVCVFLSLGFKTIFTSKPSVFLFAPSSTVVYEGCPKAFDAGIWWPKTKFGRPAAMNCPKGSIGEYLIIPLLIKATCGVII